MGATTTDLMRRRTWLLDASILALACVFAVGGMLQGCGSDDGEFEATVVKTDSGSGKSDGGASSGGSDASGAEDTKPENKPPVASDDLAKGIVGSDIVVYVMENDSDPDKDKIKVTQVTQGKLGVVAINAGGYDVTWSPNKPAKTGTDSFTYTINDGNGGTDTATVTIQINPPPTLEITSPKDGEKVKGPDVTIAFKVNGCNFTSPSQDGDGCHAHKYLDGENYKNADGKGFGQYQLQPFKIAPLKDGKHKFKLVLIKNDGTDQPFEPEIADEIAFEVTGTTAK